MVQHENETSPLLDILALALVVFAILGFLWVLLSAPKKTPPQNTPTHNEFTLHASRLIIEVENDCQSSPAISQLQGLDADSRPTKRVITVSHCFASDQTISVKIDGKETRIR